MLQPIPAGFTRPVFESQGTFRVILEAMSRPGTLVPLPVQAEGPVGWSGSMTSVVLTLCDMETPVWLDAACNTEEALRFLRFHCGCPLTDTPAKASFAVLAQPGRMPSLETFSLGSVEYPEKSTTVLLTSDFSNDVGEAARISGPGVDGEGRIPLSWLPAGFTRMWRDNSRLFPRGVDLILVGKDQVVGLPRTLKLEAGPCM
ncbi:alpha-D-ribose 1-methylphosphonate 5-triphosphate synthase subunit PhnH [Desulfomicrobium macestii]|uniref:Alpha-D-ribose 1-methylphosphonate 5-triphosphate synthase subunit PhnH n=2 Tax=Desulfomicrobium TaxID=898 RepID=A0A8G2C4V8_DESNO|nr:MULTISPECIES: phosphonate C-P lyase system protein PhnH [Desulfomicrobium]MBE1425030.1 alpha-D-ribose 1-methylphosphonate 5-triphosphate synthase subunit PhnH [Desulfomicrobium macestii]SFM03461.1 alpha-D-ribose 1-methylphosphonate 5-triphosphate synthase subunit PhnH [Desulfomicrobium norvegicum]